MFSGGYQTRSNHASVLINVTTYLNYQQWFGTKATGKVLERNAWCKCQKKKKKKINVFLLENLQTLRINFLYSEWAKHCQETSNLVHKFKPQPFIISEAYALYKETHTCPAAIEV